MTKYNKLIRDRIPEYISKKGGVPITHVASEKEYWRKLKEKLQEEVEEFLGEESIEEFADVLEVLEAIQNCKNFESLEVKKIKEKKAKERGRFKDRIILDKS